MIKKLLTIALVCFAFILNAQNFTFTYPFTNVTTTSGSVDPTPTATVVGVTSGSFTAVGTPSVNPNAGNRFSFTGWPLGSILTGTVSTDVYASMTGSINVGEYYELTLTPQTGYTVSLNTMTFTAQRSGTGIRSYAVRSSLDGFTANLPASVTTNTNLSVVAANEFFWNFDSFSNAQNGSTITFSATTFSTPITLRFYGWNAEQSGGTFSIDNVEINGSVTDGVVACNSPTITAISGNVPVCAGQTLTLVPTVLGDAPFTYTWTGSGSIGSANTISTTVTGSTSESYTLTVTNACGTATAAITTTVYALPTVSATATSLDICTGGTVTLNGAGAQTYTWTSGVSDGTAFSPTITTDYTVTGQDANNCINTATISVIVNNLPVVSLDLTSINAQCETVTSVALTGATPAGGTYSGTGVTAGDFSPSAVGVGTYTITYIYTDANGCSNSASDDITVSVCTGIELLSADKAFKISPNPSNGVFTVSSLVFPAKVIVYDVNGKQVISQNISSIETLINLSEVANGMYQLHISTENNSFNYKVMINK